MSVRLDTKVLSSRLHDIGAVRFGEFTLKSGRTSPVYLDLRLLVSDPETLSLAAKAYAEIMKGLEYDRIAGIPYAGLPIGVAVALETGRPMIYPRKETKSYGTKKAIEGHFRVGERALLLDDLISDGGSKIEAAEPLEAAGLEVKDIVVLVDREGGGEEMLENAGYKLHSAMRLRDIVDDLVGLGKLDPAMQEKVVAFLAEPA